MPIFQRTSSLAFFLVLLAGCGQSAPPGGTAVPGMPGAPAGLPPGVPGTAVPGMPAVPGIPGIPGIPGMPGVPPGAPNPFALLGQLGQMAQGMQGMTAAGAVPLVNWRELANAIPASVQGFEADGDLDGSTGALGGLGGSQARRRFRAGERRLSFEVVDTSFNQILMMPFTMARGMVVDSSTEMQRANDVGGQPGFVRLRYSDHEAEQTVLSQGRFIVTIKLEPAQTPDEVGAFAGLVNYPLLGQLQAASQAAAAATAPGTAAP